MKKHLFTLAMLLLLPAAAFAIDGQILINQSSVTSAGGFPYKITQPGSYKLTGNLAVPSGVNGINITASYVTLDLNGFAIIATPVTTFVQTIGITGLGATGVTIRNGSISGFLFSVSPEDQPQSWTLENLVIVTSGALDSRIFFGVATRVWHVTAPGTTITVSCPSVVTESVFGFVDQVPGAVGVTCAITSNATY